MATTYNILILGASYGSLLATKLLKLRIVRRFLVADLLVRGLELWDPGNRRTTIWCMEPALTRTPWWTPSSRQ